MAVSAPTLERKPRADTETVEGLVDRVQRGLVRVPSFQRGLRWESGDVVELFDSIYRGYPIGSLLLWSRHAEATRFEIGPLTIDAPETSSAWWVVDGQQRITALAAGLTRAEPIPSTPDDPYVVYFDPEKETFEVPPRSGDVPSIWVPLPILLDATRLSEWMFGWTHGRDGAIRKQVFEAGKQIREYPIPLYIVDTDDEELLREIFFRINNSGKQLQWGEVHDALLGDLSTLPSTLEDLSNALTPLGMGSLSSEELLRCLVAFRGHDVTRSLADHRRRDPAFLRGAVADALPTLRRVLSFLRHDAEIPHLRLLPLSVPLVGLVRFFALHPEPASRTRTLLVRWVWRSFLGHGYDERTLRRRAVGCIQADDEEASVQALLELVPRSPPDVSLPARFDGRAAASRIVLLALVSLRPRDLESGRPIDIARLIEEQDIRAYRKLLYWPKGRTQWARSPANRVLHPGTGVMCSLFLERIHGHGTKTADKVLLSHGITPEAAHFLEQGDDKAFLECRGACIKKTVEELGERLAGWRQNDRPSIDYLLLRHHESG